MLWRETCKYGPCVIAPKTVVTGENINLLQDMVLNDRIIKIRFLAEICGIGAGSVQTIVHKELVIKKETVARWVTKILATALKFGRQVTYLVEIINEINLSKTFLR